MMNQLSKQNLVMIQHDYQWHFQSHGLQLLKHETIQHVNQENLTQSKARCPICQASQTRTISDCVSMWTGRVRLNTEITCEKRQR